MKNLKLNKVFMHDEVYKHFRNEVLEMHKPFFNLIKNGANFFCTCCHRTLFREQLRKVANMKLEPIVIKGISYNGITGLKSFDKNEYICSTCENHLSRHSLPKLAWVNGNQLPDIPNNVSCLNEGEERLVAPRTMFMRLQKLGVDRQQGIKSNVVNIPINLEKIVTQLPLNSLADAKIVHLNFQRKISYEHAYLSMNIDLQRVCNALNFLLQTELYKSIGATISEDNLKVLKGVSLSNDSPQENPLQSVNEEEDSDDEWDETDGSDELLGNQDTLLLNENIELENMISSLKQFSIAPGEGESPLPLTLDEHALRAAYPTLFGGTLPVSGPCPISVGDFAKLLMEHKDPRFRTHPNFLFALYRILQTWRLKNSVSINLRKNKKMNGTNVTAADITGPSSPNLIKFNGGYKVLTPDRSSPVYWQKIKGELMGMIRQLGMPTFFLTFSAAETWWPELIKSLYFEKHNKVLTDDEISNLSWAEKVKLIRDSPVTCCRHFDHRFRSFFNHVLKKELDFDESADDYFFRIEFQQRGSPHVHMILWQDAAPKYGIDDKKIVCDFIDKFISCQLPCESVNDIPHYLHCQMHKHTACCKKPKRKECRFNFPRFPMRNTCILEPLEIDKMFCKGDNIDPSTLEIEEIVKLDNMKTKFKKKCKDNLTKIKEFLNDLDLNSEEIFKLSLDDFFTKLSINEFDYLMAIRFSLRRPQVFLKRDIKEIRINNYNETLIKAWIGNMDIQFILDPYSVCIYVVNYIGKSFRGMSKLLKKVVKECKKNNVDLKKQMFKICKEFQGASEVSSQEIGYHLCQIPLTGSSRSKVRINTYPPNERVKMLKDLNQLKSLSPDSEDIFLTGSLEKYAKRASLDENVNLIDFMSGRKAKSKTKIVLYFSYDKSQQFEEFCRVQLLLFISWRKETELMGSFLSHSDRYLSLENEINELRSHYHKIDSQELDSLVEECEFEPEDLVPILDEEEKKAKIINDHQNKDFVEIVPSEMSQELGQDYFKTQELRVRGKTLETNELFNLFRNLNFKQKEIFFEIINREELNIPYHFVILGKAGTGKSRLLKSINEFINHYYGSQRGNSPDSPYSIICAFTGNAAYNAGGHTFHSAFGMKINSNYDKSMFGLCPDKVLQNLIDQFSSINHLSGDEFTYIGAHMFSKINKHCKLVKQNHLNDFGGMNIVLYGDPHQLGPIFDKYIFEPDPHDPYGVLVGTSLFDKFSSHELTQIMRQDDTTFQDALNDLSDASTPMSEKNIAIFKSREKTIDGIDLKPNQRVDLFSENIDVDSHNIKMIENLAVTGYAVSAKITILGDESFKVKKAVLQKIEEKQDFRETMGLRQNVVYKVEGRYFIPVNICINDGLVNGAIGTLKKIDLDQNKNPITLWVLFDNENVGKDRRFRLSKCSSCSEIIKSGWTPIWKVSKQFPTSRKKLTGLICTFPLSLGYAFTICKSQGNNNIGFKTIVHMNKRKRKTPRKELYVAFSRTDVLQNLIIIGEFEDPWIQESERRKKSKNGVISEDLIINGFKKLENTKVKLSWCPLYQFGVNCFKITFFNVNSLNCHFSDVKTDFSILSSDVLFIIDSRLLNFEEPKLKDFFIAHSLTMNSSYRVPGGICLYVKKNLTIFSLKKEMISEKEFFALFISCKILNYNIFGIYFSPKCPTKISESMLDRALNNCNDEGNIILGGDFNQEFDSKILNKNGFINVVNESTTKWGTKIDHIYIKPQNGFKAGTNPTYYSDHRPSFIVFGDDLENCSSQNASGIQKQNVNDFDQNDNVNLNSDCFENKNEMICELPVDPHVNVCKKKKVRIIDRLQTTTALKLISFLKSNGYEVIESLSNDQIGLSCGYISAICSSIFYENQMKSDKNWLFSNMGTNVAPDFIKSCNEILTLKSSEAHLLESTQIMRLTSSIANDPNLDWFYTIDVNQFKNWVKLDFQNIDLPTNEDRKWGVFCINDAELNDQQRSALIQSGNFIGNHWITIGLEIEI